MTKKTIHRYAEHLARALQNIREGDLSAEQKATIARFLDYLAARGLSQARLLRYTTTLPQAARLLGKPFEQATRDDIQRVVASIERSAWTEWTKASFRCALKRFYKWLLGSEDEREYPAQVKWLKGSPARDRVPKPNPAELVSEEDVKRLLDATPHPRDRAFIATLWDSGARIGEVGTLLIKDLRFDQYGAQAHVTGKTGERSVRLITATPHLSRWLDQHPRRHDPNAALWVSTANANRAKPLEYAALAKALRLAFQRAGIKKKRNPHSFRHARATNLASHLTEFQMNQHFGWAQGSGMPGTYVHLSGRDTDAALLKLHGITLDPPESKTPALQPRQCARCETLNAHDSTFCRKCGAGLALSPVLEAEERKRENEDVLGQVLQDEHVRLAVQEALLRLRLKTGLQPDLTRRPA